MKRRFIAAALAVLLLTGCAGSAAGTAAATQEETAQTAAAPAGQAATALPQLDMTQWQYDADHDVYWQVGIAYCETPADESYQTLGLYVPGAYFTAAGNGDGTYACTVNGDGTVNGYTAATAPMVIPVDTPGYAAMAAPTDYSAATSAYTDAGFVYIYAGCRGRDAGAPAGVTDLKAALRYVRYVADQLPGDTDRIFSFGMSGGGAQSALLGATGDSDLYAPYLEAIGAVRGVSDAVAGSMCWCPITNLDYASEAYEWNLGVTRSGLSDELQQLSDAMAEQFALYINRLGLTDEAGTLLVLESSREGIYQAGSYYDYLVEVVETSLNNFLADTAFPYEAGSADGRGGFGGPNGDLPDLAGGETGLDGRGGGRDLGGKGRDDLAAAGDTGADYYALDGIDRTETTGGLSLSGSYETAQDYIDALNAEVEWVSYDSTTNTATITGLADFVTALKRASKSLGAFDDLDETQGENVLFGDGDGEGDHFDATMAALLTGTDYEAAFTEDLDRLDAQGSTVQTRVDMYNPLYYLCSYYQGAGTANVAAYWRIRSGINQSDTALTTEVNLALALQNYGARVDFATVWGQAHVEAERTGDSTTNFIAWVQECTR